jgi:uncharacterized protein YndB with AHSA1/START domain
MIDVSLFVASGRSLRAIDLSVDVAAPPRVVFDAWTTTEGLRRIFDSPIRFELRVGGPFEVFFLEDAPAGQQGSEGCQVMAWVPDELLAFSWSAPPHLPAARALRTWVVVTLAPTASGGTHVRLRHLGFGEGGEWPETQTYFERAWPKVLESLSSLFR